MVIRPSGGKGGFQDYMENGQKAGRDYHRDELDQRIPLIGDLSVFEQITTRHSGEGTKYDHLTAGFPEHHISDEMLQQIAEDIKDHILSAWPEEDRHRVPLYMEAHRPRILEYTNNETGENVQRFIHIHIGIGKHDTLTGAAIDPLGYLGNNNENYEYILAIQEHLNNKYGLASPLDNPRINGENAIDAIARYSGNRPDSDSPRFFGKDDDTRKGIKAQILKEVLRRDVTDWQAFGKLLGEFGTVSKNNKGKPSESYRLVPHGQTEAIRLRQIAYSRQFIERPTAEKRAIFEDKGKEYYREALDVAKRRDPEHITATLRKWHEVKARENRYIHTGSKFYKEVYQPADYETRRQILDDIERKHHALTGSTGSRYRKTSPARNRLPGLSTRDMDGIQRRSEMLLRGHDGIHVSTGNAAVPSSLELRRTGAGRRAPRGDAQPGGNPRQPSSLIERNRTELRERYEQANDKERYAEIRKNLDCNRLLARLAHSHGVKPQLYQVTTADDGTPRIQCGTNARTPNDFLTKELGLAWRDAAPILRDCYAAQLGHEPQKPRNTHRPALWSDYRAWRQIRTERRATDWERQKESEQARRAEIKRQFHADKGRLQGDRSLSATERKAALSLARMQRIEAEKQLREAIKTERDALRVKYQGKPAELYRDFLAETVEGQGANAEKALAELRRLNPDEAEKKTEDLPHIKPASPAPVAELEPIDRALSYRVARNGDVTYQVNGQDALTDEGRKVRVLRQDQDTIETGLRLAVMKFGDKLTLTGTDEFKRQVVAVAVEKGIRANFTDPALQQYKAQLEHDQAEKRRLADLGRKTVQAHHDAQRKEREKAAAEKADKAKAAAAKAKAAEQARQKQAEIPAPTVPNSRPADKPTGIYKGEVHAVDAHFVYQQTKQGMVHHHRGQFAEVPRAGDNLAITYQQGRVTHVKDRGVDHGMGR